MFFHTICSHINRIIFLFLKLSFRNTYNYSIIKLGGDTMSDKITLTPDKIAEVNALLLQGYSLTKLEKENKLCGYSRRAFSRRAEKLGYEFDKTSNQLVQHQATSNNTSEVNVSPTNNDDSKYAELDKRLKKIEDLILSNNNIPMNFELDESLKECDIITRSFKVNPATVEKFNSIAETKLAMYTKQQLLSQALLEFYNKYK